MKILVTGANGFVGKNLCVYLERRKHEIFKYDLNSTEDDLRKYILSCDFIVHLAGINRPLTNEEFYNGNTNFTKKLIDLVKESKRQLPIIFASSIQAELDNDYGKSKKLAEDFLFKSGLPVYIFRLANVFGKWCRPNYNSAAATFCYNIAHDLPIEIRDPNYVVHYNYIGDICREFCEIIEKNNQPNNTKILSISKVYDCSLGRLAELLKYFKQEVQSDRHLPTIHNEFEYKLFVTFLDYLSDEGYSYNFAQDERGFFIEHFKSKKWGQISTNVSYPGITKGGHYHTYKNEIFYTCKGHCLIRQKHIETNELIQDEVYGEKPNPIWIKPNYTHDIKNIGDTDSLTLMWISEVYNPETADTFKKEL